MKQMKKRLLALAALACLLAVTALAAGIPAAPKGSCVLDEANVLSAATEQKVNELTAALDEACGAQLAVLTVDFTGTLSMEEYAYQVFDAWGVGDKKKNNGVLLLLVIGDENYYCTVGTGLEKELPPSKIDALLWDNLEDGFAAGDYDRGVTAFAGAMYDELCSIYKVQPGVGGTQGYQPPRRSGFGTALVVIIVSAVLVLLILVSSALHPVRYVRTRYFGYVYPPRPPRWWHRHYHRPPHGYGPGPRPPRPPHGGFGGFGGGSGSQRPPGGASFKGFGGGSSRGGGAGRRSGGSRPSGGAGRRK